MKHAEFVRVSLKDMNIFNQLQTIIKHRTFLYHITRSLTSPWYVFLRIILYHITLAITSPWYISPRIVHITLSYVQSLTERMSAYDSIEAARKYSTLFIITQCRYGNMCSIMACYKGQTCSYWCPGVGDTRASVATSLTQFIKTLYCSMY